MRSTETVIHPRGGSTACTLELKRYTPGEGGYRRDAHRDHRRVAQETGTGPIVSAIWSVANPIAVASAKQSQTQPSPIHTSP
jgi:hypothetical protein